MKRELLRDFQAIANREFRRLISEHLISEEEAARSTLGTVFGDKFITFELYMPAETPQEAKVIATLKIDLKTREVDATVP